jgi:hypothetical protein
MAAGVAPRFLALSVSGLLLAVAAKATAEDIMLSCNGSHIVLRFDQGQAELIDHDPVTIGSLTVNNYAYEMRFPATEKTYEIRLRVNRYTGEFEWEHGRPPFFEFNAGNVYRTGTCVVSQAVQKF